LFERYRAVQIWRQITHLISYRLPDDGVAWQALGRVTQFAAGRRSRGELIHVSLLSMTLSPFLSLATSGLGCGRGRGRSRGQSRGRGRCCGVQEGRWQVRSPASTGAHNCSR